jgi:hypothetical protein
MSRPRHGRARGARAAFTILEILVAAALLAVIAGIVLGLAGFVLRQWTQASAPLGRDARLQQAHRLLREDFEAAVITPDDRSWLWLEGGEEGAAARWLVPSSPGPGLELVEWVLRRRTATGAESDAGWSLFRIAVPPGEWPARHGREGAPGPVPPHEAVEASRGWWQAFVLGGIVDWEWELHQRDERGRLQRLAGWGADFDGRAPNLRYPLTLAERTWRGPDALILRLRVLAPEAAERYAGMLEEGLPPETTDAFLLRESATVTWRLHTLTRP